MSDPSPGSEEPRTISDQQMIFRSAEDPIPKSPSKKLKLKATKIWCKIQKSTPAPPSKGNGRKRFVHSPLPEDKQLRKKLSYWGEDRPDPMSSKCKADLSLAFSNLEESEIPLVEDRTNSTNLVKEIPVSGVLADIEGAVPALVPSDPMRPVGHGEDTPSHDPQADKDGTFDVQTSLGRVKVNMPHLEKRTNPLLESALIPF